MLSSQPCSPVTKPQRRTGSLTLSLKRGDEIEIVTPEGVSIVVFCADATKNRVSLNVRAPRDYAINRHMASDEAS